MRRRRSTAPKAALHGERARSAAAAKHPAMQSLLGLQRAAGNRAVSGLLESTDPRIAHPLWHPPPEVDAVLDAGGGRSLEPGVRDQLEPLVGEDLSDVRVHADEMAAASAEAADARAYSAGEDIVFGPGRYAPETEEGRGLLAHEVGHVVASRQSGGGAAQVMRAPKGGVGERLSLSPSVPAPRVTTMGSTTIATIYFARDIWLLEPEGLAVIEKLAERLSYMVKPVVAVDGYASSEGPPQRNDELARNRREAVIATLSSKAPGLTFGGKGHGSSDPAAPEIATNSAELEGQRALNRRAEIVISDMTAPAPETTPKPGGEPQKPTIDIFHPPTMPQETPQQEFDRRMKDILKLPPDLSPPKKSLSDQFWSKVDEKLNETMSKLGIPEKYRSTIKDGAHALIQKGLEAPLDKAMDAAHLSSQEKDAIKSALGAAAQTKAF